MQKFRKPVLLTDAELDTFTGGADPQQLQAAADKVAQLLLTRVRNSADPLILQRVLAYAAHDAADDLAPLWEKAHALSAAGVLWRLYLLRQNITDYPETVTACYRAGINHKTEVQQVIAGIAQDADSAQIQKLCDKILRGIFAGDITDALNRASAYCALLAAGAAIKANNSPQALQAKKLTRIGVSYQQLARELQQANRYLQEQKI